jgi:PTH1 family peptidyl-tRNA hydrolase
MIIGLGNIGEEYKNTRHNVGFMVIDCLIMKWNISLKKAKYSALLGKGKISSERKEEEVVIAKPLTFMNLSGRAVKPLSDYFMVPASNIIVVHDDIDLKLGKIKIKIGGSDAGHKGISSIAGLIGPDFIRIRIGIGRPNSKREVPDYVLATFDNDEKPLIADSIKRVADAIETIIFNGLSEAQRKFNG